MRAAVRSTPQQLREGLALGAALGRALREADPAHMPRRVVVCGVGGSAFPAELLKLMLEERGVRCELSRGYQLSNEVARSSREVLLIACSFSGNTEETLSSYQRALDTQAVTVAISAGGKLEELATGQRRPHIKLTRPSESFQPRAATGLFLGALVGLVETFGLCAGGSAELSSAAASLEELLNDSAHERKASQLTAQLEGKIPIFYASAPHGAALAQLAKIKINENAKQPAFWSELPEANHNELIGYTRLHSELIVVLFIDPMAPLRLQTRARETLKALSGLGVSVTSLTLPEVTEPLAQLLATLYVIDLTSCALALRAGLNPNEVEALELFKQRLGPFKGLDAP